MMNFLYLVVALFLWAEPVHAGIFFDSDFETCAVSSGNDFLCEGWNDFGQESLGHLQIVSANALSGTKSVLGTFDGRNGNTQQPSIWHGFTPSTHVFTRVGIRHKTGFLWGQSNGLTKLVRIISPSGAVPGLPTLVLQNAGGKYLIAMEGVYDSFNTKGQAAVCTFFWDSGVPVTYDSYDQVEIEWLLNTPGSSNGLVRLWINNTLRMERLNLSMVGPASNSTNKCGSLDGSGFRIGQAQIYIQAGLGEINYDRIAVRDDTRFGIIGSPPPQDTTAPTPPTSVAAQ